MQFEGQTLKDLIGIQRNPVPTGARAGVIAGFDGLELRYGVWDPTAGGSRGTVCLFGGRGEFIEKYFETIGDLRRRGFHVATMDWRGQGGSGRLLKNPRKGHVEDFSHFDRDLEVFMKDVVLPDCPPPYFALAHSMGGNILLRASCKPNCWFERIVAVAPMLHLSDLPFSLSTTSTIIEGAMFLGMGDAYIFGGGDESWESEPFEDNELTTSESRFARNKAVLDHAPEIGIGAPTIGWLHAALQSMAFTGSIDFPATVHVPTLMFAAGYDSVVDGRAIEELAAQLKAGSQIVIEGARHEILQERDEPREQFWAGFDAFIPGSSAD